MDSSVLHPSSDVWWILVLCMYVICRCVYYNSSFWDIIHVLYMYPFKGYDPVVFSLFTELYTHHHYQIIGHLYYPRKKPCTHYQLLLIPISLQSLKTLFLWIYPFRTFHINAIIHYVAFCDWLSSLCTMFSRFTHTGMYQYFIPVYCWISCLLLHCMDVLHFIYPFIHWWIFVLFSLFLLL